MARRDEPVPAIVPRSAEHRDPAFAEPALDRIDDPAPCILHKHGARRIGLSKRSEVGLFWPTVLLVGIGAAAKSAQVPLHIWLPNAMEAPTPVSAFLHSATMVKAGVYLVGRLRPLLVGEEWTLLFATLGLATMLVTAVLAVAATDVKELLAYSTASHLGLIVAAFGFANVYGAEAGAPNPFGDVRVRRAVAHAISVPAILQTIMRGSAEPADQLVSVAMRGATPGLERPAHDPEEARRLLEEAGYPEGFSFGLKCPNDRYLNDEAVCQAIVGMLAQVGIEAVLDTMPVRNYWPELREDNFDMYLLGWSPGTFDAEHPIRFLVASPDGNLGTWNFGGFSSARVDELLPRIQSTIDPDERQAMLDEVAEIVLDEMAYIPLYVQPLLWGTRENVELVQRPDNFFILRWVRLG